MLLTETHVTFRGIRPLQKLSALTFGGSLLPMTRAHVAERLVVVPPDPWPGDSLRGRELLVGVFRFAGHTISKEELSWHPTCARPEWIADLHGFEWLRDLRSVGGDRARRMAREMVASWLDLYPKYDDTAWRADITGVRLASWITFHDFFCVSADEEFQRKYFESLARQAQYLFKALPGSYKGIALMKALKGLAFTGIALEEGQGRLEKAFRLILKEIHVQVHPDGSHISRSPQVTFEFLKTLVDLRAALISARLEVPDDLQYAIDRMAPAVKFFRHADGTLAHFNGAQEGNPHLIDTTLMHSGARGKAADELPHGGYQRLQSGRSIVIVDTGLHSAAQYADRSHAGLLSFEYSYGKDRVIVNCGSSEVAGKWRDLLKTTAAHSALVVDNRNSCQFDESGIVSSRPELNIACGEDGLSLAGHHKGYVPRFGLKHGRRLSLEQQGEVLSGEDVLSGKSGVAYAVRFHLHPQMQASVIQDGAEILLRSKCGVGWRFKGPEGVTLVLEDSVYGGEGEMPRRSKQIVIHGMTTGPETTVAWELKRDKNPA